MHVPNATAGIFQAMMLFFILASDILVRYRLRIIRDVPRPAFGLCGFHVLNCGAGSGAGHRPCVMTWA